MVPLRPRRFTLGAGYAIAVAIAGCGGGSGASDEEQVAEVLRSFLHAQAGGDGQRACALLSPAGQRRLITLVAQRAGPSLGPRSPSCEEAVGLIRAVAPPEMLRALDGARIEQVRVEDARATADVVDATQFPRQHVVLTKTDAGWRITAAPGLAVQ